MNLYAVANEYAASMSKLLDSDLPDEVIADTLEGMSGEVEVKAQNVVAFMLNIEAEAHMIREAEKKMAMRRQAIEAKVARFREYLQSAMELTGITEIKANDGSFVAKLYLERDAVVVIDDDLALPPEYVRVVTNTSPDKVLIKSAIKLGKEVPGARVEMRNRLEIK